MFDSHAHYDDEKFNADRDEVIHTAHLSGVDYILNASSSVSSSMMSIELAGRYDFIYASVGIHPHEVDSCTAEDVAALEKMALDNNKVVAVGEIGLDYYYAYSPREKQQYWFAEQIRLAKKLMLPVIIHDRDAYEDTLRIIRENDAGEYGGVMHCYSGGLEMLRSFLDNNMYISIGGPVTFRNARKVIDIVRYVPIERLLVETDCPYLAPEPFRGKRNDSSLLRHIIQKIAEIRGMEFEKIRRITTENAIRVFRIKRSMRMRDG